MLIRRATSHSRQVRTGAHLVEFAVVAPVLFLFVLGLVEFGRGMMASSQISHSARLGCRVGVLSGNQNTDVTGAVDAFLQGQGIAGYTTTIQVNGDATKDVSSAQAADTITVQVSVPMASVGWLPNLSFLSGYLNGQFSMPHE